LEDRLAPAVVSWIAGSGDWDTAGNWLDSSNQTNHVPGSTDDAVVSTAAGVSVTHSSDSTVNKLTLAGATLDGPGSILSNGIFTWSGGTLSGGGSLTAAGGMSLSGSLTLDGCTLVNPSGQTATWSGSLTAVHGARLNNYGVIDNNADSLLGGDQTAAFNNYGAFVKTVGDPSPYYDTHANPNGIPYFHTSTAFWIPFLSTGSIEVRQGELMLGFDTQVTISGTLVGRTGTQFSLEGGANVFTSTSSIDADQFLFYFADTTVAGSYRARRTDILGTAPTHIAFTGAVGELGPLTVAGALADLTGASLADGVTTLPSLFLSGTLRGAYDFTVAGAFNWAGGKLDADGGTGSLTAAGGMAVSGNVTLDGYTLVNPQDQRATWSGNLSAVHASAVDNYGVIDNNADSLLGGDQTAAFNNYGAFVKTVGDPSPYYDTHINPDGILFFHTSTAFWIPFLSTGSVEVKQGELMLGFDTQVTVSGTLVGRTGTQLSLEGGTNVFTATSSIDTDDFLFYFADTAVAGSYHARRTDMVGAAVTFTGPVGELGPLTVAGGVADLTAASLADGVTSLPSLFLSGTLRRADDFTVAGAFTWAGGTLDAAGGAGSLTATGGISITAGGTLDGYTLNNPGLAVWTAGNIITNNGAIFNNEATGTLDIQADGMNLGPALSSGDAPQNIGAPSTLINAGTITKSFGTNSNAPSIRGVIIHSSGVIHVQQGGLSLGYYSINSDYSGSIQGDPGTYLEFVGPSAFTSTARIHGDRVVFYGDSVTISQSAVLDAHRVGFDYDNATIGGTYRADYTEALNNTTPTHVTFTTTSVVQQLGVLAITAAVVDLTAAALGSGATTLTSLDLLGGTLRWAAPLTVSGSFTTSRGFNAGNRLDAAGGAGSLTVNGGMLLTDTLTLDGFTLVNPPGQTTSLAGTLYLYHGAMLDNEGILTLGGTSVIARGSQDASAVLLRNRGTITKSGSGGGGLSLPIDSDGTITLSEGSLDLGDHFHNTTSTFRGPVTGTSGTLVYLTGASTYLGDFKVDRVIYYDASDYRFEGAYHNNSSLTRGTVTITGTDVQLGDFQFTNGVVNFASSSPTVATATGIDSGATLTGNGHLLLRDSGNYSQARASSLQLTLGGNTPGTQYDQIRVAGSVQLDGNFSVALTSNFQPHLGSTFTVINNEGCDPIQGTFRSLDEGAVLTLSNGTQLQISYHGVGGTDGIGNDVVLTVIHTPIEPGSFHGLVWQDFNNDGQVDFGERAIEGVVITLTGTDYLGNPVQQTASTDAQGIYEFLNVWPGTYTLSEAQPAGYADGRDNLGTVDGQPSGDASVNDQFSGIVLPSGGVGINYNFGERPVAGGAVHSGQTATIGFWQNRNGQNLIKALPVVTNPDGSVTSVANWLAATFPNLYGDAAGANNLAGKSNADVAAFFTTLFSQNGPNSPGGPPRLDAQVLASALAVYVTNQGLAGTTASVYGFQVTAQGAGYATFNVGSNGAAFGVASNTTMTVLDILLAANARTRNGLLYDLDSSGTISSQELALREMANQVFTGINEQGDI
jgi:hypothetical protein